MLRTRSEARRRLEEQLRLRKPIMQNFSTVGLFDGTFRPNIEETGMGYDLEVEMIRLAHEPDLLTALYATEAAISEQHVT